MSRDFEELDYRETPLGPLILRRRRIHSLDELDVFEVKLGDAFLMSSLFTTVEIALANLGLADLGAGPLDGAQRPGHRPGRIGDGDAGPSRSVVEGEHLQASASATALRPASSAA